MILKNCLLKAIFYVGNNRFGNGTEPPSLWRVFGVNVALYVYTYTVVAQTIIQSFNGN